MRAPWFGVAAIATFVAFAACLPGAGPSFIPRDDAGLPPPTNLGDDGGIHRSDVDLGDPFAIDGLTPSHGPWTGGTRARVSGRGFSSKLHVTIGGIDLGPSDIFASEPTRAAVVTPPGTPGPADVTIRDDATAQSRTLPAGFFYDAFVLEPNTGGTSGGTRVALSGSGTNWVAGTTVTVAGAPCAGVTVVDATHLTCTTPTHGPGTTDVDVITPDKVDLKARDAFTYSDSPDGYRGGLAGGALAGNLKVLAFDSWVGVPIPGAQAIAGGVLATAIVKTTDASGVAELSDPSLTGKVTVTVAAKCHQPITFVAVPVDTVTAYLDPVLDPTCGSGDPPSSGNFGSRDGGEIDGELVWKGGVEFEKSAWVNVPSPIAPTERRAAYIFTATGSPWDTFSLPPDTSATTTDSPGNTGYAYAIVAAPGNATVYALAGIEDRSVKPPRFTAYAMGVARGIPVSPSTKTTGVDIPMTTLLDHQVVITPQPPAPGPRGPDTFIAQLSVTLGQSGFASLPIGTSTTFLPGGGNVSFVGVPALDGTLSGESYALGAAAVTGPSHAAPASIVSRITTTNANTPVTVGGFLAVPTLIEPATQSWGGTHVQIASSGPVDLVELFVTSGAGLVTWTLVAPGGSSAFDVPDLALLPNNVGLVRGPLQATGYVARLDQFDYGTLRYGQLSTRSWNAYAVDSLAGAY